MVNATTEGVVRPPSALVMMVGLPPSMAATAELVVPRSMPTTCGASSSGRVGRGACQRLRASAAPIAARSTATVTPEGLKSAVRATRAGVLAAPHRTFSQRMFMAVALLAVVRARLLALGPATGVPRAACLLPAAFLKAVCMLLVDRNDERRLRIAVRAEATTAR